MTDISLKCNSSTGSMLLEAMDSGIFQSLDLSDRRIGLFQTGRESVFLLRPALASGTRWTVTIPPSVLERLAELRQKSDLFLSRPCLWVPCGQKRCVLWASEWLDHLDLSRTSEAQTVGLECPPNRWFRVWINGQQLVRKVPASRFPKQGLCPR
jgi:hypothetical protein